MFTLYASDEGSFNCLLNEFTAILATNGQATAKLYTPRSFQRIKDTDKVAFVKRVDFQISEGGITEALKDVGFDVIDVVRLTNKELNTPTLTIKVTFADAHNRNTLVHTVLQVDSMHFIADPAKHNSKPVQCYVCLKYNHIENYCKKKQQLCARCGDNHHVDKCSAALHTCKCCNCNGNPLATSNEYTKYMEQEKRRVNVPKPNGHSIGLHCGCNSSVILHHKIFIFIPWESRQNSTSVHMKKYFLAVRIAVKLAV